MPESDDLPLLIVARPRRGRGRPRAPEPRASVSAHIPATLHDRLIRYANAKELSVSAVVGRLIARAVRRPDEPGID